MKAHGCPRHLHGAGQVLHSLQAGIVSRNILRVNGHLLQECGYELEDIDGDRLLKQAIIYLSDSDREDEFPNDPVARFHLGNGATLERVNLDADLSLKGIHQSKGIMVNYLYNLDSLERNHELFFKTKIVKQSDSIKSLRKKLQIQ